MDDIINFPHGVEVITGAYILNEQNELLLAKSPKLNKWSICGGHIETGETIKQALKREISEELGIEIEVLDLANVGELIVTPPEYKRNAHFVFIDYWAKPKTYDFKFNEEISEIKWFKFSEIVNNTNISPTTRELIKKHLKQTS